VQLVAALAGLIVLAYAAGRLLIPAVNGADVATDINVAAGRSQTGIDIAQGLTRLGSTLTLTIVVIVAALGLFIARQRLAALFVVVCGVGSTVLDQSVKYLVQRPRPATALQVDPLNTFSYPSGHATGAAAIYLALALVLAATVSSRRPAVIALAIAVILAIGVAWSRVYLGVHYPSDVAAGLLLGGGWTMICWRVLRGFPADR
jgi:undecaprenyl-diphosphatase